MPRCRFPAALLMQQLKASASRMGFCRIRSTPLRGSMHRCTSGTRDSTSGASSSPGRRASAPALEGRYGVRERAQRCSKVQTLAASVGYNDVSAYLARCYRRSAGGSRCKPLAEQLMSLDKLVHTVFKNNNLGCDVRISNDSSVCSNRTSPKGVNVNKECSALTSGRNRATCMPPLKDLA